MEPRESTSARPNQDRPVRRFLLPGTFDPITLGHLDVIERASHLCDEVVVGVAASRDKRGVGTAFTLDERVELAREACAPITNVKVLPFEGLLVDFAHEIGATALVKGLRAITDFEYEFQQANLNNMLAPELEAIFVMSYSDYSYISSSAVRELAGFGGDVSRLVTPSVEKALRQRYSSRS